MNTIGNILLFIFFVVIGFLYLFNIYKLIKDVSREKYNYITVLRGIGIFFIPFGILMGVV